MASFVRDHVISVVVAALFAYAWCTAIYVHFRAYKLTREAVGVKHRVVLFFSLVKTPLFFSRLTTSGQPDEFLSRVSAFDEAKMKLIVRGYLLVICSVGIVVITRWL